MSQGCQNNVENHQRVKFIEAIHAVYGQNDNKFIQLF